MKSIYLIDKDYIVKIIDFDNDNIVLKDGIILPVQKTHIIFGAKEYNHILFSQNYNKYKELLEEYNLNINDYI